MSNEQFDALAWAKRAAEALRACHNWMQGEFSDSDFDRDGQLSEADAAAFSAAYDADKAIAAIALMRGQSEGRIAAGWFVCVNGVAVSEAFDTRQKAEAELASRARFYNDLYAEPCYVSGAYVSLPKDTADEQ